MLPLIVPDQREHAVAAIALEAVIQRFGAETGATGALFDTLSWIILCSYEAKDAADVLHVARTAPTWEATLDGMFKLGGYYNSFAAYRADQ
jgi:hypothetical protein